MKTSVYAIAKNEEKFAESFMRWARRADSVVILDTGSTDRTVAKLRGLGAVVHERPIVPWRFDVARNESLALVPADCDVCVCMDLDESLDDGWLEHLRAAWNRGANLVRHAYVHPGGAIDRRSKIHARRGFRWKRAVHEGLEPLPGVAVVEIDSGVVVVHHPDATKPRSSYLPLLEILVREEPTALQHWFWLAREYVFHERWAEAIASFEGYLLAIGAHWEIEDAKSCHFVAMASERLGRDAAEVERWLVRAIAYAPRWPEAWVELGKHYLARREFAACYAAAKRAQALHAAQGRCGHYLCLPEEHEVSIPDLVSVSAYYLAQGSADFAREAREGIAAALAQRPSDERLLQNRAFIDSLK